MNTAFLTDKTVTQNPWIKEGITGMPFSFLEPLIYSAFKARYKCFEFQQHYNNFQN